MKYISDYQINTTIDNLANSVLNGEFDNVKDTTTLTYYGMKIRGAMDNLVKKFQFASVIIEADLKSHYDKLKAALDKLTEMIKQCEGLGSLYFSNLTEDSDLRTHPYVKLLDDMRTRGLPFDKAVSMVATNVGAPELAVSNFIKQHNVKYPIVCETSVSYVRGQEDARRLVGTNALDLVKRMYDMQMKFLRDSGGDMKKDGISYVAGFSSMMGRQIPIDQIRSQKDKASLLAKYN